MRILVQWTLKIKTPISTPIAQLLLPNWDPSKTNSEENNKRFGLVATTIYYLDIYVRRS
jgi:hypothetical protein